MKLETVFTSNILLAVVLGVGHSHALHWECHSHSFWKAFWKAFWLYIHSIVLKEFVVLDPFFRK